MHRDAFLAIGRIRVTRRALATALAAAVVAFAVLKELAGAAAGGGGDFVAASERLFIYMPGTAARTGSDFVAASERLFICAPLIFVCLRWSCSRLFHVGHEKRWAVIAWQTVTAVVVITYASRVPYVLSDLTRPERTAPYCGGPSRRARRPGAGAAGPAWASDGPAHPYADRG